MSAENSDNIDILQDGLLENAKRKNDVHAQVQKEPKVNFKREKGGRYRWKNLGEIQNTENRPSNKPGKEEELVNSVNKKKEKMEEAKENSVKKKDAKKREDKENSE